MKETKDPTALATLLAMGGMMAEEPRDRCPLPRLHCKDPNKKSDPAKRKARKATKKARRKNRR
jgi:hypothetical protein